MVKCRPTTEVVTFLYQCIVFTYYSIIPQLILHKLCLRSSLTTNGTLCQPGVNATSITDEIHQEASRWWFYMLLCDYLPGVFTILISGTLTDIIGRRKFLLAFPLVDLLASIVFLLNAYFVSAHPIFLIPGFLMLSLFGESNGVAYVCNAFVADIDAKTEHRTPRMALVEAGMNLAGIVGSLSAGFILQIWGFSFVFVMVISIDVILFLYVYFFLGRIHDQEKESESSPLINTEDEATEMQDANVIYEKNISDDVDNQSSDSKKFEKEPLSSIYIHHVAKLFRVLLTNRKLFLLLVVFMFVYFGTQGELLIQTLYLKKEPFSFTPQYIGYYGAVQAGSRGLGTILISQFSFHLLHLSDYSLVVISCLSQVSSLIIIGSSTSQFSVFIGTAISFSLSLCFVAIRSILTKEVPRDSAGAILSLVASLSTVMALLGNLVSVWTYEVTLVTYSGVVYFVLAVFPGIAVVVTLVMNITLKCQQNKGK